MLNTHDSMFCVQQHMFCVQQHALFTHQDDYFPTGVVYHDKWD